MRKTNKALKLKLAVSFFFLFTAVILITGKPDANENEFQVQVETVPNNISSEYLLGAMDNAYDLSYNYLTELGLNVWHKYVNVNIHNDTYTTGWDWYSQNRVDNLYNPLNMYSGVVTSRLENNQSNGMRTLMQRPKVEMLAFGQRSDYQCEEVSGEDDLWFYSFQSPGHAGVDINDSWQGQTQRVRYCERNIHTTDGGAGWVVSRLKANNEQCNTTSPVGSWQGDNVYDWYIKPRIRIDSNFAHNNPNTSVCRIEVDNFEGNNILSIDIKGGNFLNGNNYDGRYLEEFYNMTQELFIPRIPPDTSNAFNPNKQGWAFNSRGNNPTDWSNKMDIKVYWYGNCDMWIDYVRVDNETAHRLLKGSDLEFENWLQWEAELATHNSSPLKFYIEEFQFNHIPCMSYVSRKLKEYSNNANLSLMSVVNPTQYILHLPYDYVVNKQVSASHILRYLIDSVGQSQVFSEPYSLTGKDPGTDFNDSYVPNTLPVSSFNISAGRLGEPVSPSAYDDWLQSHLDAEDNLNIQTKHGYFTWYLKTLDTLSKARNIPHINMPQAHLWYYHGEEVLREPTYEELEMTTLIPVTYGARGSIYFAFTGFGRIDSGNYGRGLTNPILSSPYFEPRVLNAYEQPKWERVKSINQKLKQWEPYIMSFDNENRKSFIYRIPNERSAMTTTTFINELKAFPPVEFAPEDPQETDEWLENSTPDIANSTYVQAAFFNRQDDGEVNKYFMIVNRRCSPYISISSAANVGGRRLVTMKVNPSQLPGFNNWKVINLEDSSVVAAFNKNSTSQIYIGDFMPGQGKLFKVAPVMQEGGILVTDEEVNSTFTCKGMIYSTDRDIYLGPLTKISFATSAGINMTGGIFQCGEDVPFSSSPELKGQPGSFWSGIELNECSQVMIHKTVFKNLAPMKYAVSMVDCFDFNVSTNTFLINDAIKVGAVRTDYLFQSSPEEILAFFNYNNITINSSIFQTFQCNSYGSANIPLMMNGNTFTAAAGSTAIGLFNIGEAVIKNNIINNYTTGISIFGPASYADLYENTFSSTLADSKGITVTDGSVNLGPAGIYYMGGLNHVTVSGNSGNNIELDGGYFNINKGENTFNITDITLFGFHFTGTFQYETSYEAAGENCFMFDGNPSSPSHTVINPVSSDPVNFDFDALTCSPEELEDFDIFSLGGGEYDTVYMESGGSGGGFSSTVIPVDLSTRLCISSGGQAEALAQVELYSEINIEMRKRNYEEANEKCYEFLDLYINDERSLNVLSRLYLSSLMLDSAGSMMTTVKTFYENLILSHGESENLVRKAFYLLQKCKASLGLYSDAMSGFQEIINQNPYNYIGLAAKWDYMAVHLLDSLSGTGGGIDNDQLSIDNDQLMPGHPSGIIINDQLSLFDDKPREVNLRNDYDKKFTQVQKEQISGSIKRSLTGSREEQVEAVRELVKKVEQGDKRSAVELDKRNRLNESVIIRKPRDIAEHRNIIREDIEKVFAAAEGMQEMKDSPNLIPQSFELYQNFPNPFNPATKIRFDLPQSAKVTLRVYDILGRELVRIVNNTVLDAGAHVYDFSSASGGTSLASGVYFYRLETTEPGSSNILFLKTKKMVLLR